MHQGQGFDINLQRTRLSLARPDEKRSPVGRIVLRNFASLLEIEQNSGADLDGKIASVVPFTGFYEANGNQSYLMDYSRDSFLLAGPNRASLTDCISKCTAVGVSNGRESLICHFTPEVVFLNRDHVFAHSRRCIDFLRKTATADLKGIIYSGDENNGLPLESLLKEEGIPTLALIGQKAGYEGAIAYVPKKDHWHVNTYLFEAEGDPASFLTQPACIQSRDQLRSVFDRVTCTLKN